MENYINNIDNNILIQDLINTFTLKYPDFKGVYFIGSRAKNKFNESSDYDLVFVFDRKINSYFKDEIRSLIYSFDLKYNIVIDSKIYNFKDILDPITPFRNNVRKEGIYYAGR
jgi:predicted nucleotidyltransferase